MTNSELPNYVIHAGDSSRPQPYKLGHAQLWGWVLKGTQEKLQLICDENLNRPRLKEGEQLKDLDFRYQSLSDYVFLFFDSVDRVIPSPNLLPIFSQPSELFFSFPCIVVNKQNGFIRLVWHIPFIYLGNNDPSIITGREVYGFPKAWAEFTSIPELHNLKEPIKIQTLKMESPWTYKSEDTPEPECVKKRQLIEINNSNPSEITEISFRDFFKDMLDSVDILPFFDIGVKAVNLKQFRDVEDGAKACYQAITEASFIASGLDLLNLQVLGKYEVIVKESGSHPFVSKLGLQGEVVVEDQSEPDIKSNKQIARAFFNPGFDFTLEPGKVIWRAN
jgi:hypothetical protein